MSSFVLQRSMKGFSASQVEKLKEIGDYLRQQRENKGLSLAEVASATFIHLPILEALEAGAVEGLPEPIYVRGFIRRYSEMLPVDGESLIEQLSSTPETAATAAPPETPLPESVKSASPDLRLPLEKAETQRELPSVPPLTPPAASIPGFWLYLLGLAAAVALGAWYFLSRPPVVDTTSDTTAGESAATPSPMPTAPAPTTTASLSATVTMVGDSWLQVKVDGKTEYEGILVKGQTKSWTAQEQLLIKAGNAGAVNLSVNQATPKLMGSLAEIKEVLLTADGNQSENQ